MNRIESKIIFSMLGAIPDPPVDLFRVAWQIGVGKTAATAFPDGFTDFRPPRPVIFLNKAEAGVRMRFIFAHELAHVMLRHRRARDITQLASRSDLLANEERFADSIAATLLLPDRWISALKNIRYTLSGLEQIADLADVSRSLLVERMSSAEIDVALLVFHRSSRGWHLVDRPGAPAFLRGHVRIPQMAVWRLEQLHDRESFLEVEVQVNGRNLTIGGTALRRDDEVALLIESCSATALSRHAAPVSANGADLQRHQRLRPTLTPVTYLP